MIALAAFSKSQLVNSLRSAALLCPIAYVGQMSSPLARNAAKDFLAEVKAYFLVSMCQASNYIIVSKFLTVICIYMLV